MPGPSQTFFVFEVSLADIKPRIWRKIVVPAEFNLLDLHHILQIGMGWFDSHLHLFQIGGAQYSSHDDLEDVKPSDITIASAFRRGKGKFQYVYDFGDNWVHDIVQIERFKEKDDDPRPPMCIDGAGACPPEDVGGVSGYTDFLATIGDKRDERQEEFLEWIGGKFDPKAFNHRHVSAGLIGWWRQRMMLDVLITGAALEAMEELGLELGT